MKRTQADRIGAPGSLEELQRELAGALVPSSVEELQRQFAAALEQQAATARILEVINRSAGDLAPVYQAVLDAAQRLLLADSASMHRVVDAQLETVAVGGGVNLAPGAAVGQRIEISVRTVAGTSVLERQTVHVPDVRKEPQLPQNVPWSRLAVPIIRGDEVVGVITVAHHEAVPFTPRQVSLLETFAGQVGIAIENARLLNETKEALERQTAIAEILRAISASPSDVQPVLDAIAENATRFCGAEDAVVGLVRDGWVHAVAHHGPIPGKRGPVFEVDRRSLTGRAILDGTMTHTPDMESLPEEEYALGKAVARELGYRGFIACPLLKDGRAIGTVSLRRREPGPFTDEQIGLLQTFADQAVIAIENVRLFNETKEALEQQTASAEILSVIAGSPTDVQPVLQAIAGSAADLCAAEDAAIGLVEGDMWSIWAHHGPVELRPDSTSPVGDQFVSGHAMLERRTIRVDDLQSDVGRNRYPGGARVSPTTRAIMATPLLRQGNAIGAIFVRRNEAVPFTERHAALIEAFASQAVIAIENVRLFNETKEALERQTAISEILRVISSSPTDVQPVLDTIAVSAARYCGADDAGVVVVGEGGDAALSATQGGTPQPVRAFTLGNRSVTARSIEHARLYNVPDMEALSDEEFADGKEYARELGYRAFLTAPLLKEGRAIGAIQLRRNSQGAFSAQQVELVQTFAAQAVIAIENVRLFNETKEALEQQAATARVLQVISRSAFDLRSALETLVEEAARLCAADHGSIHRWDGSAYRTAAFWGPSLSEEYKREGFDSPRYPGRDTLVGRTALERDVVHILDATTDPEYKVQSLQKLGGYRTMLGVPLMRDGFPIGVFALMRGEVHPFTDRQIELVRTFADQAAIAIENVRLFNETKEALEQQSATRAVLEAISAAALDLDRIFRTIVENSVQLCRASSASLLIRDGEAYRPAAHAPVDELEWYADVVKDRPLGPGRASLTGRVLIEGRTIQIPDVREDPEYSATGLAPSVPVQDILLRMGPTLLGVPVKKGDEILGVIIARRTERPVRPFSEREIGIIETFADQAAIAIDNVRLFRETEQKSRQLEVASRHKSEFLANMSHELRTPLNAIIGFTDVMLEQMFGPLNDKQKEYLEDVRNSGTHLLTLINDILDLSKVEAGRIDLEIGEFSFPEALDNVLTLVRERATRHGISLAADVAGDVGTITADERKVKQIMVNLLANAVKFTPDGGRVTVKARRANGEIEVAVHDTGIGVATEDQDRIFSEFQQVGRDPERSREGTGLGLTLAKRFVELHGGRIWVESEVGKGSTFTFAIPVRQTALADAKG